MTGLLDRIQVQFTNDYEMVTELKSHSPYMDFFDAINDKLTDSWIIEDSKAFALYEALYGLTKNYEMVWCLFSPLIKSKINFEFYYTLSSLGGVYSFSNEKVFVAQKDKQ